MKKAEEVRQVAESFERLVGRVLPSFKRRLETARPETDLLDIVAAFQEAAEKLWRIDCSLFDNDDPAVSQRARVFGEFGNLCKAIRKGE